MAGEISQYNSDREKLRAALALQLNVPATEQAEKPDAQPTANAKVKTLAQFNDLNPAERMAFVKDGGKISNSI